MRRFAKHDAAHEESDIIDDVNPDLHLQVSNDAISLPLLISETLQDENAFLERKLDNNMEFMVPAVISKRIRLVNVNPESKAFIGGDDFILPIMLKVHYSRYLISKI